MTASILAIIASALGLTAWWVKRKADQNDAAAKPGPQNKTRYEEIDSDIATQNSTDATAHSTADLDELERLQRAADSSDKLGSN